MSEQIPVNPVMLRWARETGGFGIDDVVVKLKRKRITSETVASWEKGAASPTYVQLERLAYEIYKRPLALFFFLSRLKKKLLKSLFGHYLKKKLTF